MAAKIWSWGMIRFMRMNKISERNIIYVCMQNIFIIIVIKGQWNAIALWWQYFDEVAVGGSNNIFPLALLTLCNISCIHAIIVEKEPFRTFQVRRRVKEVNVECSLSGNIYVMYAYFIGSFYMDIHVYVHNLNYSNSFLCRFI